MKKILFFVLAALTFAACDQALVEEQSAICPDVPETITVGFEGDDTRIQLNDAKKTVWTKGDLVSVFYLSDANQQWQYTGETGARTAKLTRVNAGNATTTTTGVVVVYPYNENYYLNTRTLNVKATLPATQTYLKDSYGLDGNIMISQSEYNNISLKNVCGWLKLQLTGNGEQIKSITVRGNNGEQVAGELYINSADATATLASDMGDVTEDEGENATGGAGGNLVFEDTVLTEVTLNCLDGTSPTEKGVALGAEATAFYIALPPQTFTKGITVEITDTTNFTMTQSTDKEVVIERNHIKPMTAFKFVNPNTPTIPTPANNEIWYTATAKVEPYYTDEFGAKYLSNVWDSETGNGVITFEGDVTKIGYYAFYGYQTDCNKLTSVTIPDSVTTIGEYAFYWCDSLTSVTIPDSVTTIGNSAFNNCYSLTSVTIPDSVTTIGEWAFRYCDSLTSVTIPDSVTTIGNYAFNMCSKLTSVTIGNSVTTIGNSAFSGCSSLKEFKGRFAADGGRCLIMGNTIIAYAEASGTTYTILDSVTRIGYAAFSGCSSLTSVTIPDSVTTIGEYAFSGCRSLTSVTIPDSVTTIGGYAFSDCESLTSITIPDSVTTIGVRAFYDCDSLTSVTIPDSVKTIEYGAFQSCNSLKTVYCKPTTPPTGGSDMFDNNAAGRRIFVPASDDDSIINAYKTAYGWKSYSSSICEDESL